MLRDPRGNLPDAVTGEHMVSAREHPQQGPGQQPLELTAHTPTGLIRIGITPEQGKVSNRLLRIV